MFNHSTAVQIFLLVTCLSILIFRPVEVKCGMLGHKLVLDPLLRDCNNILPPYSLVRPAPKDEDEMMVAIFEYIDRIFNIVRPRRLLYMAIDGVAPRAKMNQQRSRRFRASKESR